MTSDFAQALRRLKPERRRERLRYRPPSDLRTVPPRPWSGRIALVPDTNVYINAAAGRLPAEIRDFVDRCLLFHCSVCLAELAVGIASRSPDSPDWHRVRDHYRDLIDSIPGHRILTPTNLTWNEAGVIAGTLARTQGLQPQQRKDLMNDALIHLMAARAGLPVLTSNRGDFDLIQQMAACGEFFLYDTLEPGA
ncbi:type II toxin-antitoxin system VapC family toxin [Azospirillum sp. RWY-5-1]|uniref:Type II toxin-antitoxin system VapC family toxin n=1 Tax=Azospirillum oleiclasticum TaxID=2735135 RepID=A0ABX2TER1_9PROT|nr:type II toxin-antitoxin system VapC family toxin [Azospirillum oleiclasticum]NYZ14744.1 type II toxin-antitoxin system VapC family toxin [Azospirillum oleiclasticum]NYZ22270.1 type II toxin-antitoxin system VapC family toxin [Azospirillum oleiclasticum]